MYSDDLVKSAESGDVNSMVLLAVAYMKGLGVPADSMKAVPWLEKAAELGSVSAQKALMSLFS